jgi:hypothetical protein
MKYQIPELGTTISGLFKDNFNTFFLFHCTLSMHLSSTRTGLKVDGDNIPELGGFLSGFWEQIS